MRYPIFVSVAPLHGAVLGAHKMVSQSPVQKAQLWHGKQCELKETRRPQELPQQQVC